MFPALAVVNAAETSTLKIPRRPKSISILKPSGLPEDCTGGYVEFAPVGRTWMPEQRAVMILPLLAA
jgi:hypothetical protein